MSAPRIQVSRGPWRRLADAARLSVVVWWKRFLLRMDHAGVEERIDYYEVKVAGLLDERSHYEYGSWQMEEVDRLLRSYEPQLSLARKRLDAIEKQIAALR